MPRKYKKSKNPRTKYPEIRPGVKQCPVCKEEFYLSENADASERGRWPYKRFCCYKCNQVQTARDERARHKSMGRPTDYYRKEARHRINQRKADESQRPRSTQSDRFRGATVGASWMDLVSKSSYGTSTILLEPLPPEAKTKNIKQAFFRVFKRHTEFGPMLLEEIKS